MGALSAAGWLCFMQARTGIFTAAQVGVYDESKHRFMKTFGTGSKDVVTQFGASLISGLVTTTAVAPADIIKTRMFAGGVDCGRKGQ